MVASRSAETGARRRITEPKGDGVDLRRPGTWRWNAAAGSLTKHLDALSHKVQSTVVTLQLLQLVCRKTRKRCEKKNEQGKD